jgi:hypothetical protein
MIIEHSSGGNSTNVLLTSEKEKSNPSKPNKPKGPPKLLQYPTTFHHQQPPPPSSNFITTQHQIFIKNKTFLHTNMDLQ